MAVQEELEIGADGVFGRGTEAHVKAWQEENGLTPDGIMGPASLKLMFEG
jgi:peptidoglycan hydrolase-like protein with peptidoglycan-binding domain